MPSLCNPPKHPSSKQNTHKPDKLHGGIYVFLWDSQRIALGIYGTATHIVQVFFTHTALEQTPPLPLQSLSIVHEKTALSDECAQEIQAYFDRRLLTFSLPLMPKGSIFQKNVWEILRQIPYGETRSYKDIALRLHNPNAARAVGNANSANPIAILIPCHRVIHAHGGLGGYAYGSALKAKLLGLESQMLKS